MRIPFLRSLSSSSSSSSSTIPSLSTFSFSSFSSACNSPLIARVLFKRFIFSVRAEAIGPGRPFLSKRAISCFDSIFKSLHLPRNLVRYFRPSLMQISLYFCSCRFRNRSPSIKSQRRYFKFTLDTSLSSSLSENKAKVLTIFFTFVTLLAASFTSFICSGSFDESIDSLTFWNREFAEWYTLDKVSPFSDAFFPVRDTD
mmetsp:Transcript_22369/g.33325  ORF Transcript_22369/g.33325 Transcript_22369/m.33325 type:complete len:200 (+) Transcript_22369:765-1364(+)